MENQPLKLKYPSLFNIVRRKEFIVATILASLVCDCVADVDRGCRWPRQTYLLSAARPKAYAY
jgi:hypothetical protein